MTEHLDSYISTANTYGDLPWSKLYKDTSSTSDWNKYNKIKYLFHGIETSNNTTYMQSKGLDLERVESTYEINNIVDTAVTHYRNSTYDLKETCWTYGSAWTAPIVPPGERIRQMIRERIAPAFHRNRTALGLSHDIREKRARGTLRRIIGEEKFRRFIRDGFITVVSKTGLTYRIFPGHGITEVYARGIMVERFCVVLTGQFPPTDELLMRYLLILNDEGEFTKSARKQGIRSCKPVTMRINPVQRSLPDLWAEIKQVA